MDAPQWVIVVGTLTGVLFGFLLAYFALASHLRRHYESLHAVEKTGLRGQMAGLQAENRALEQRIELLRLADNVNWVEAVERQMAHLQQYIDSLEQARGEDQEKHSAEIHRAQTEIDRLQADLDAAEAERRRAESKLDEALAAANVSAEGAASIKEAVRSGEAPKRLLHTLLATQGRRRPNWLLEEAVDFGDTEEVKVLLDAGFDPDSRTRFGDTLLHIAVHRLHPDVAQLLLAHEANPDAPDGLHRAPLHLASLHHSPEMAELLLRHGARVDPTDNLGRTPLHWAAVLGRPELARLFLSHGADVTVRDHEKHTPLDLAAEARHSEIADLIRGHEAT